MRESRRGGLTEDVDLDLGPLEWKLPDWALQRKGREKPLD